MRQRNNKRIRKVSGEEKPLREIFPQGVLKKRTVKCPHLKTMRDIEFNQSSLWLIGISVKPINILITVREEFCKHRISKILFLLID